MLRLPAKFLFVISLLLHGGMAVSADNSTVAAKTGTQSSPYAHSTEAQALWQLIEHSFDELKRQPGQGKSASHILARVFADKCDVQAAHSLSSTVIRREAYDRSRDFGLELRGAYTSRSIEETDDESSAYLELSWNILKGGYFQHDKQARALEQRAEISELKESLKQAQRDGTCRQVNLAKIASRNKSVLLALKHTLMNKVYHVERRAYFKGWSYLDDYLVAEAELKDVKSKLQRLHQMADLDRFFSQYIDLPLFDINLQEISQAIANKDNGRDIAAMQRRLVKLEHESNYRDSFRIFVRNEFDVDNNPQNSNGLAAGLRFSIPLSGRTDSSLSYKLMNIDETAKLDAWERQTHARQAYHQFKIQLEQTIEHQYRYLRAFEKMRRTIARQRLTQDVHIPIAVKRLMSALDAAYELLATKEKLYQRANTLLTIAQLKYKDSYFLPAANQDIGYRGRSGERSIYVWSKTFNSLTDQQIIDLLFTKGISRVLLSAGRNTDRNKLNSFLQRAAENRIKTEVIVGANEWIYPKNHQRAAQTIALATELGADAVHIDIEPHTLSGYHQQRSEYLKNYLTMLQHIRSVNIDSNLSVAVPLHWPDNTYQEVNRLVNRVYLMAYETNSIERLTRRVHNNLRAIDTHKAVVVLRPEDFKDEWEMEKMFQGLVENTGIIRFGIHDLQRYNRQIGLAK